jgi:hypothetical protein
MIPIVETLSLLIRRIFRTSARSDLWMKPFEVSTRDTDEHFDYHLIDPQVVAKQRTEMEVSSAKLREGYQAPWTFNSEFAHPIAVLRQCLSPRHAHSERYLVSPLFVSKASVVVVALVRIEFTLACLLVFFQFARSHVTTCVSLE